jgi:hypothetical protein
MGKQLNIRSDEAYEIAHRATKLEGTTVTEVVTAALRHQHGPAAAAQPEVPPEQAAETYRILMGLSERSAAVARPGVTSDHRDFYDEVGLPI